MSSLRFPLVEYQDASAEVQLIYDDILKYHHFVPNWFKCQASNPGILKGNWAKVKVNLFVGEVPLILKQMILLSISRARGCKYCVAIHAHSLKLLSAELNGGKIFDLPDNLDSFLIPSSYKVAVDVVTRIGMNPQSTSAGDIQELADEGFSTPEIQELIAQADLAIFINTFSDIAGIPVDEEIKALI